tara:strand:+ start:36974 stop:37162 length:189 start_codon:yes stop_codon:yes gene_type:complete
MSNPSIRGLLVLPNQLPVQFTAKQPHPHIDKDKDKEQVKKGKNWVGYLEDFDRFKDNHGPEQ